MTRPLRVGINALYLRPGKVGGSEVYLRSLIGALVTSTDVTVVVFAAPTAAASFEEQARSAGPARLSIVAVGTDDFNQARRLWAENVGLVEFLRRTAVDVLFSPANFGAPALPMRIPQVITIHDLQHRWLTANFSRAKRLQRTIMFRASIARARHVIAISEFTRNDVIEAYGVGADRITTVLEGFDEGATPSSESIAECRSRHGLSGRTLYYPATDNAHKNHELLIDVLGRLGSQGDRPTLVLTGSTSDRFESLMDRARRSGVAEQIRHLGFVSRDDVYALMAGADAMVFPSRFEGFGLPILEAMECKTPVIASKCASLPEVAGDAAILLGPDDVDGWVHAIVQLQGDPDTATGMAARGKQNLRRFSWTECAVQTAAILDRAAQPRSD